MRRITTILFLSIFFSFSNSCLGEDTDIPLSSEEVAWLSTNHTVRVRIAHAPPFMFTDGNIRGIAIDYLTHIFNLHGIHFTYVMASEVTWPQALKYIEQHDVVDMVPTAKVTDERKEHMLFTNEYITAPWVIFTRSDANFIASIEDLKGKLVSVEEGFVIHNILKRDYPQIRLKVASAKNENYFTIPIKDLSTGLADAYIGNLLSTTYMIQTLGYMNVKVAAPTPFENHNQAMAIRNDWPELASIINKTLTSMTPDEHTAIRNRWLGVRYEYGISYTDVVKWILSLLAGASLVVGFVLLSNRRLKKEVALREKIEADLLESENRLRSALDATPFPVAFADLNADKILYWSRSALSLFGHTVPTTSEWFKVAYPNPDYRQEVIERWQPFLEIAKTSEFPVNTGEYQITCKDGSVKTCELYATFVIDYLIVTFSDITERKKSEVEREKLQAQLNQAQKIESVGRLAGGVAHDFNNMLGVILGHTEMALDDVDPAVPLYASLQAVQHAAERSAALTRQLLAFARKQTVAPKVIDINDTVEGMLNMLRRLIGENIDLLWLPGRSLNPVKMDPTQIDQILANLCVNSRDAIKDVGKVMIETSNTVFDEEYCVQHAGFVAGEYVLLAVSDDGCGMDQETISHMFEPFFTTKEQGKGTGLGLASVYGAVKQNSGFINVYSESGQGTTFKIYLPRYAATTEPLPKQVPVDAVERGHETILLVEDEPAILEMTTMMLIRLGYTVVAASTPGEAIHLAHESGGHIDLLMTDVVMPEMNGRELAGNLLSHYPDLKRLFMSGYTANVIAHHGVLDEGVNFIQKPFSMKDLGGKLRETLEG